MLLYLRDRKYKDYKPTFTGHSLGGALATLAAFRTVSEKWAKSEEVLVYTFGQPRVGSYSFATAYNHLVPNSYRVVNAGWDLIPHIPPCRLDTFFWWHPFTLLPLPCYGPYYHTLHEVWYRNGWKPGDYTYCEWGEQRECSRGYGGFNPIVLDSYDISKHHEHMMGRMVGG